MITIYARVSTKDQSEKEQIPSIIATFALKPPHNVYNEEVSAWNIDKASKRLEFKRLINDIKLNKVTELYIWDIDRLYLNVSSIKEFYNMCKYYNTRIFSVNQKELTTIENMRHKYPDNQSFINDFMFNMTLDLICQKIEEQNKQ